MRKGRDKGDREKFVTNNKAFFDAMDFEKYQHNHKSDPGKLLVEKARRELKYSATTASCDIFWNLVRVYQRMKKISTQ